MKLKKTLKITLPYAIGAMGIVGAYSAAKMPIQQKSDTQKNITIDNDSTVAEPAPAINIDSIIAAQARPSKVREQGRDVIYICENGDEITRKKGSRAWRNNNPGNLVYTPFTRECGAIGECGKYAVFPDEETGMNALRALLRTTRYQKLTITGAINIYSPEGASGVALYISKLTKLTGLPATTRLSDLNAAQLNMVANSIREIEGWILGTETRISKANPELAAQRANAMAMRDTLVRNANTRTL